MRSRDGRLIELLQSARPMRLFRNCRFLPRKTVDEILELTRESTAGEAAHAVGEAVRSSRHVALSDGRRLLSHEIDALIARLSA
jgi:hypothetical protein